LKLRSLRIGLPAVKEFGEPSTKLEFDEFDDMTTDGGQLKEKTKPNRLRRKSMKAEKAKGA
jgi:hypothetical protein